MDAQGVMLDARVAHVRELKSEIARLKAENAKLRDENAAWHGHFDQAVRAAADLSALPPEATFLLVDGWNLVLGANKVARDPSALLDIARRRLAARPDDFVWIVFDGPRADSREEGRLRVSYTGGTGPHRADRFICDFLRMAAFSGCRDRIEVCTDDKDLRKTVSRLGGRLGRLSDGV